MQGQIGAPLLHQCQRLWQAFHRHQYRARRFGALRVVAVQRLPRFQPLEVGDVMHAVVIFAGQHHRARPAVRNRSGKGGATLRRAERHLVGDRIKAPGFQSGEHAVPQRFLKIDGYAEFFGDGAGDFDVVTGELAARVVVVKRWIGAVGGNDDGAVVVDARQKRFGGVGGERNGRKRGEEEGFEHGVGSLDER